MTNELARSRARIHELTELYSVAKNAKDQSRMTLITKELVPLVSAVEYLEYIDRWETEQNASAE
jgi:hypothetical protein